jgi:hypothetical protein
MSRVRSTTNAQQAYNKKVKKPEKESAHYDHLISVSDAGLHHFEKMAREEEEKASRRENNMLDHWRRSTRPVLSTHLLSMLKASIIYEALADVFDKWTL